MSHSNHHVLINHNSQSIGKYDMRLVLNERETQRIFIALHTLKHLCVCTIGSTNNIKPVFDFVPRLSNMSIGTIAIVSRIWVRKTWSSSTGIANTFTYSQRKKSSGGTSGERGGQWIGPSCPIQWSGKDFVREFRTSRLQCGGLHHAERLLWVAD